MKFSCVDLLKMRVRKWMAVVGRCFMWRLEMLSGPVAGEFFRELIASIVSVKVNLVRVSLDLVLCSVLSIFLFWGWVGLWLCVE